MKITIVKQKNLFEATQSAECSNSSTRPSEFLHKTEKKAYYKILRTKQPTLASDICICEHRARNPIKSTISPVHRFAPIQACRQPFAPDGNACGWSRRRPAIATDKNNKTIETTHFFPVSVRLCLICVFTCSSHGELRRRPCSSPALAQADSIAPPVNRLQTPTEQYIQFRCDSGGSVFIEISWRSESFWHKSVVVCEPNRNNSKNESKNRHQLRVHSAIKRQFRRTSIHS